MATPDSVLALIRAYKPSFRNPHDKIAFAVHATFLASGYVPVAVGPPAFSDTVLSSPSTTDEAGIEGWNATDDGYGFLYRKEENGAKKSVLVKCLPMGDKLIVDALVLGGAEEKPVNLQIDVNEYDGGSENTHKNFGELVSKLNSGMLAKLGKSSASCGSSSRAKARERLEDELDDQGLGFIKPRGSQTYPSGLEHPPVPAFGEIDLIPGGGAGAGAGIFPGRGTGIGGGMLLGPNDPHWFGGADGWPGFSGGAPGIPPGVRFDPYGPPGVPGFDPNNFIRNPRRPGGSTHPDLEPFGSGSDFI